MRSRSVFLIITILIFLSCKTKHHQVTSLDNIIIYDNYDGYGEMSLWGLPDVLILKKNQKYPELNSYGTYFQDNISVLGKWEVKEDTLYLFPLYEFYYDTIPYMNKIDIKHRVYYDRNKINQKWVIDGDCINERTDFSMFNEYDDAGNVVVDENEFANRNYYLRLRSKTKLK